MAAPAEQAHLGRSMGELKGRLARLRSSAPFQNYHTVRDHVLRMKDLDTGIESETAEPSEYWAEELRGFEYMLDASPLVIESLRHHAYHVTGLRHYDYRTGKDRYRKQISQKLEALREAAGGAALLVPEPRALGGFGFEIDGQLYNLDTLKYYECLIAMDRGGVLAPLSGMGDRRVVWEIGAGWGGLAYQFKRCFPNVTYVISDFPELFLFSAVNLMTLFPNASFRFYGEVPEGSELEDWDKLDFVFLPHTRIDLVRPPRLDLTINTVSFQEMTTRQVEAYVEHAFKAGSPYLYSLNRERSLYNPDLRGVSAIIEELFWPHVIEVLPVSYVHMLGAPKPSRAKTAAKALIRNREDLEYKHIVGWRRVAL